MIFREPCKNVAGQLLAGNKASGGRSVATRQVPKATPIDLKLAHLEVDAGHRTVEVGKLSFGSRWLAQPGG
jgi:hypothetical protein